MTVNGSIVDDKVGPAGRLPVCVIIPAYNRAGMLKRALDGVWSQRPELPAEVIVVDDGLTDESAEVAEQLGARVIRHPRNLGLSAARNTGLEAATQPWIALLDSDDEWLPHHLAHLWELHDGHSLVASSSLRCGATPNVDRYHGPPTRRPTVLRSGDSLIFPGNIIPVSASMVKRDLAQQVGGFRAWRGVVEDFDLWLRILEHGTAVLSPRVGVLYHLHDDQMSMQDHRTMQVAHMEAGAAYLQRTGSAPTPVKRWEAVAAWDNFRLALSAGDRRGAAYWCWYVVSRPYRWIGLLGILRVRYLARRRTGRLHAAGLGPASRRPSAG